MRIEIEIKKKLQGKYEFQGDKREKKKTNKVSLVTTRPTNIATCLSNKKKMPQ